MSNIYQLPRPPVPEDLRSIIDAYLKGNISLHVITVDRKNNIAQYSFGKMIPDKVSRASRNRA